MLPNKKPRHYRVRVFVPETGFEPARRFQRHHLKVVRLPILPAGRQVRHMSFQVKSSIKKERLSQKEAAFSHYVDNYCWLKGIIEQDLLLLLYVTTHI